jgi:hypothetical protein
MSGGVVTNVIQAVVDASKRELDGKTLSVPALLVADGDGGLSYCVDVDIGQKRINQNTGDEEIAILKNVAIASGDQSLLYADVGAAVRLRRSDSGRWEIVGYSKRIPGTYFRIGVQIGEPGADPIRITLSTPTDITVSSRPLTYDELATIGGGYGVCPYGAIGLFRGDELVEVR